MVGRSQAASAPDQLLLAPPGDVPALADGLQRVLSSPERRRVLGAAPLARARAAFSIDRMTDAYERLYFPEQS